MTAAIVGEANDPHVEAVVLSARSRGADVVVIGCDTLIGLAYRLDRYGLVLGSQRVAGDGSLTAGWIRRLTPARWREEPPTSDLERVERAAWTQAIVEICQMPSVEWISTLSALDFAEGKVSQYRRAMRMGIPVPEWFVGSAGGQARLDSGTWIIKPIGPAEFTDNLGRRRHVFASPTSGDLGSVDEAALASVPFIVQRQVDAVAHLRVVTVGGAYWISELSAPEAIDWRSDPAAHSAFVRSSGAERRDQAVGAQAVSLCRSLELGFSSQDWIWDGRIAWLIDVNPSGQWLFLPDEITREVTEALADCLTQ